MHLVASGRENACAGVGGLGGPAGRPLLGLLLALVAVLLVACARGSETREGPDDRTPGGGRAPATTAEEGTRGGPGSAGGETSTGAGRAGASEGAEGRTAAGPATGPAAGSPSYGYTHGMPSGNRVVEGAGGLPGSEPVDVGLSGEPAWVVGAPVEGGTAWVVALGDGRVEAFRLDAGSGSVRPWPVTPDRLPAGLPPALMAEGEDLRLLAPPDGGSTSTHPVPVSPGEPSGGSLAVAGDGAVFEGRGGRFEPVGDPQEVVALPDARAVRARDGRIAVLSDPTRRYVHGVVGDDLEADAITVLEPEDGGLEVAGRVFAESGGVFELVLPLWFVGPDGRELLAVTESAEGVGSRIAVYEPGGALVAAGPFFGEPQRWRHLLAAGPFGPKGGTEIAAVRTPRIGGVVEFYRLDAGAGELEVAATRPGYSSHAIYSRNLDTARAGDLDGDGRWELLVPNQGYTELGAVRHGRGGAEVAWTLPLGGTLATNLADANTDGGRVSVAAGRTDGVLRIWP